MSVEEQMIFKNELQTSETCAILDMSRQNLYKMRKEGRMHRLIESQDSKFYKESVYQEWFQRHIKALNMQLPLTPMEDMTRLMCSLDTNNDTLPFKQHYMMPIINVLLSNYGTTQTPVKIPYEYTMRFYHILTSYLKELLMTFNDSPIHNSRIESEINAYIQSLYQQTSYENDFKVYIEALKAHCNKQGDNQSLIKAFIEATDVFDDNAMCHDYINEFIGYYSVFRESLVITLLSIIQFVWSDIHIYQKSEEFDTKMTMFNGFSNARKSLFTFIKQLLALLYDARGVLS